MVETRHDALGDAHTWTLRCRPCRRTYQVTTADPSEPTDPVSTRFRNAHAHCQRSSK